MHTAGQWPVVGRAGLAQKTSGGLSGPGWWLWVAMACFPCSVGVGTTWLWAMGVCTWAWLTLWHGGQVLCAGGLGSRTSPRAAPADAGMRCT